LWDKFHLEILMSSRAEAKKTRMGWGKISHFLAVSVGVNISKTLADTAKGAVND